MVDEVLQTQSNESSEVKQVSEIDSLRAENAEIKQQLSQLMEMFANSNKLEPKQEVKEEVKQDAFLSLKSEEEAEKIRREKIKLENENFQRLQTNLFNTEQNLKNLGYGDELLKLQNMSDYKESALEHKDVFLKRLLVTKLLDAVPQTLDDLTYQDALKIVKDSKNTLTSDMIQAIDKLLPIATERYKMFFINNNKMSNSSNNGLKSTDHAFNLLNANKHAEPLDIAAAIAFLYPKEKQAEMAEKYGLVYKR